MRGFEGQLFRVGALGQRRVRFAVGHIGAVPTVEDLQFALGHGRLFLEDLQRLFRRGSAAAFRFTEQLDRFIQCHFERVTRHRARDRVSFSHLTYGP